MNQTVLWIEGMTCGHCVSTVQRVLSSQPNVHQVQVSLSDKKAILHHSEPFDSTQAIQAVQLEGFKAGLIP